MIALARPIDPWPEEKIILVIVISLFLIKLVIKTV
jgi:hypothetical protein